MFDEQLFILEEPDIMTSPKLSPKALESSPKGSLIYPQGSSIYPQGSSIYPQGSSSPPCPDPAPFGRKGSGDASLNPWAS